MESLIKGVLGEIISKEKGCVIIIKQKLSLEVFVLKKSFKLNFYKNFLQIINLLFFEETKLFVKLFEDIWL